MAEETKGPQRADQADVGPSASPPSPEVRPPRTGLPVVGLGASAGGLAALETFFTALPPDTGMAFVVVQHLDPGRESLLPQLLRRHTALPVAIITDGLPVEANRIYVLPPNRDVALAEGRLQLLEPIAPRGLRLPIDHFFRSLAQDRGERAVAIVLSGTGTDGTLGLEAIQGEGGLTIVQTPESAEYDGMPRSAIRTGLADVVLPPAAMPSELLAYAERAFRTPVPAGLPPAPETERDLRRICAVLRARTGHDFSEYKPSTLQRRVARRMAVAQLDRLEEYLRYLHARPAEAEALFRDLLIGVTSFFRDSGAYAALVADVLPVLGARAAERPLRIWVPACATGEEPYSLAMILCEHLDGLTGPGRLQIYATDIDSIAIAHARAGLYPESIAMDVSAERLSRFFVQEDHAYRVSKTLRELIVFSVQDVLRDPPFSRLDFLSCRNLLIYLSGELQRKLLPIFRYALQPDGFLWLGSAESLGDAGADFTVIDHKWKIYQRHGGARLDAPVLPVTPLRVEAVALGRTSAPVAQAVKPRDIAEQALLASCVPPAALTTAEGQVLYIHGRTGRYLEPAEGDARMDLLAMAREGLRVPLGAALHRAASQGETVTYEGVRVQTNGDRVTVTLVVRPLPERGLFLVSFQEEEEEEEEEAPAAVEGSLGDVEQRLADLERQLGAKEAYLRATLEQLQAANEELRSANEELQAGNEELQSTNEELESAKEELQSVNEELQTLNAELQMKVTALEQANDDMANLFAGTGIGTIFVDHQLRIRRFTPAATQIIRLLPMDIGRPVTDLASRLVGYTTLVADLQRVLDTLVPVDGQVQTEDGRWFAMRLQPYRTQRNVIEGAVLTFVDMSAQRLLQDELQAARTAGEAMLEVVHELVLILDGSLTVRAASPAYYALFQTEGRDVVGRKIYEVGEGVWDIPALRKALEEILPRETRVTDFPVTHDFLRIGRRNLQLNAREVRTAAGERLILLAMTDVSAR